ncbi:MAG TPA: RNA polymerase sigma-70 factor [Pedobacter sp.]|nr:RNA polymerase sigma-70 factor [Pedobacter sp.]
MFSYTKLSDQELLALLKRSDRTAFAEVYDRYKVLLHTHAYKKFSDREEVKDIIQDVFTTLWKNRESNELSNLPGYLYAAVRNSLINHITRKEVKAKYVTSMQNFSSFGQIVTDHLIREKQLANIIEKEIEALPTKMRIIFELSRKEHLSHKEIAKHLTISEKTVDKQISNALKILKNRLGVTTFLTFLISYHQFK